MTLFQPAPSLMGATLARRLKGIPLNKGRRMRPVEQCGHGFDLVAVIINELFGVHSHRTQ